MEKLFKPTSQSDVSFVGAQPQAVPIFQYHAPAAGGGWKYYYSASPNITSGWTLDGVVFFVFKDPGATDAIPVYQYHAANADGSGERYCYSADPNLSSG